MLHLGYEIWICDRRKQRLPEYDIKLEGEDGRTMVCYIPSESGKGSFCIITRPHEFQVRWNDHNSGPLANYTSMRVSVDGHAAGKTHCSPGSSNKRIGIRTASADKYQPFQFSDLQTTDDDGALWAAEKLGSITATFRPQGFAGTASVHEHSKKVALCRVGFGTDDRLGCAVRVPEGPHRRVKSTPLDGKAGPVARFVFRYRPATILRAQGIMPPKGSTSSKGANSPRARPVRQPKQERGATSVDRRDRKPVKTEPGHKPGLGDVSGDVIDLSSDDDVTVVKPLKRESRRQRVLQHDPSDVIDLTLD